jgi:hypothetical protein
MTLGLNSNKTRSSVFDVYKIESTLGGTTK